ncbi:hypothetical protein LA080_015586, partial [Diaporthe eres]
IKFERVQNAPFDSAVAYSNPAERHGIEKNTPESHTLIGWQDFEAQHPLGPFTAVSRSHDSLLVNNDQPHQTPSTLSGSDGPPPSRETDQAEHAMFWGAQDQKTMHDGLQDSTTPKFRRGLTTRPTSPEEADAAAWLTLGIFFVVCLWGGMIYWSQRSQPVYEVCYTNHSIPQ